MRTYGPTATPKAARALYLREPGLYQPGAPALSPPHRREVSFEEVSQTVSEVLQRYGYQLDPPGEDTWGVWTTRVVYGLFGRTTRQFGDCDDAAVEVLRRFLALGMDRVDLKLTRCRTEQSRAHLVLNIRHGGEDFIADQRRGLHPPQSKVFTGYSWIDQEGYQGWYRLQPKPTLAQILGLSRKEAA